jgi:hypothetical protein
MKTTALVLLVTLLVACKKEGVYYKYAYIDEKKTDVVTTHLIPSDKILSNAEINALLVDYRNKKHYVRDTIVLLDANTLFLLNP